MYVYLKFKCIIIKITTDLTKSVSHPISNLDRYLLEFRVDMSVIQIYCLLFSISTLQYMIIVSSLVQKNRFYYTLLRDSELVLKARIVSGADIKIIFWHYPCNNSYPLYCYNFPLKILLYMYITIKRITRITEAHFGPIEFFLGGGGDSL